MDHETVHATHIEIAHHAMGPIELGWIYLALTGLAILLHAYNGIRARKLSALSPEDKDLRANRMERNMAYVCAGHIPMGLSWVGLLHPLWAIGVGLSMVASEGWLVYRTYQRAKQVYAL